jgi:hypothetical protein
MSQSVVEGLILKTWDSNPEGLFEALKKKGDDARFVCEGDGGLGHTLESALGREAFYLDKNAGRLLLKSKNIIKLAELTNNIINGIRPYKKNMNKYTICLMFIIKQPNAGYTVQPHGPTITLQQVVDIKAKAFKDLAAVYQTVKGWVDQTMSSNGGKVLNAIKSLENEFKQELLTLNISVSTHASPVTTPKLSASLPPYGEQPRSTSQSNSHSPPSASLSPRASSSGSPTHGESAIHFSNSGNEEKESKEHKEEKIRIRHEVKTMLKEMRKQTKHPADKVYKLHDIKVVQKFFFNKNIYTLTFKQLRFLSTYMYDIQRSHEKDESFDDIRTETNLLRRFFGYTSGNTQTWQEMANELQNLLLELLLKQKQVPHLKLLMPASQYDNYSHLFSRSFTRSKWGTPAVYKRFREHCSETKENDSPAMPTRVMSPA